MQFNSLLLTALAAAGAAAQGPVVTPIFNSTTVPTPVPTGSVTVVDYFTTICPQPTVITYNSVCYTATTAGQTITITNCPCTIPVPSTTYYAAPVQTYAQVAGAKKQGAAIGGVLAAGAAMLAL